MTSQILTYFNECEIVHVVCIAINRPCLLCADYFWLQLFIWAKWVTYSNATLFGLILVSYSIWIDLCKIQGLDNPDIIKKSGQLKQRPIRVADRQVGGGQLPDVHRWRWKFMACKRHRVVERHRRHQICFIDVNNLLFSPNN